MLNQEDRRAIEGLFQRLEDIARKSPDRDRDAEELIDREIGRQPGAPYYMAQTILVQQHALEVAERRIEELEREAENRQVQRNRSPWDRPQDDRYDAGNQRSGWGGGFGGGGFLGGAMQTALGVAGGVLLGSAIGSLLGAGGAHASEAQNNDQAQDNNADQDQGQGQSQDQGQDQGDAGNDSGDWGDFGGGDGGGFDMGGDF